MSIRSRLRRLVSGAATWKHLISYHLQKSRIFVLGNQKSGTTVIAALLAEHAHRSATLDIHWLHRPPQVDLLAANRLPLEDIVRGARQYFCRAICKEPLLTFYYDALRSHFPTARFLLIVRDPRDNIRSILDRLKLDGRRTALTPGELATLPRVWQEVIANRALGLDESDYVRCLAFRWRAAADLCLDNQNEVVLCRYEDFLADKLRFIKELAAQLGLKARRDIAHLLERQYQPKGERDVDWTQFYGERNLAAINEICHEQMAALGYRPETTRPQRF